MSRVKKAGSGRWAMAVRRAGDSCRPAWKADLEDAIGAAARFIPRRIVKMLVDAVF
jgi:hypothetical protein